MIDDARMTMTEGRELPSVHSHKYLYERLGSERFQTLCAALVASRFEDAQAWPVGQKDGGRDVTAASQTIVLQVKFTRDAVRNPVAYLKSAMKQEDANIRTLVERGCKRYILITNVEGSAARDAGDRDRLDEELKKLERHYQVPMSAVWRSDLDTWVDDAGSDIKWSYVDMLAGAEALVALLRSSKLVDNEKRQKSLLLDYVGTSWQRDKAVKFKQVEIRSDLLTGLFVDLEATRRSPLRLHDSESAVPALIPHLISTAAPFSLLDGVPGQGKSTVAQYLSQVYRAEFIGRENLEAAGEQAPEHKADVLRVPFRIDLADYANWIAGTNPFDPDSAPGKPRKTLDLESFLREHVRHAVPGGDVKKSDLVDILDRYPSHVILDGLDEVANSSVRSQVVDQIDAFMTRRARLASRSMKILVTTRPNSSKLAEPSPDKFERLIIGPLNEAARIRYLRLWGRAQGFESGQIRTLERTFSRRSAAPHVAQLANNPMQLTILLHLMNVKVDSLPTERTALYREYMALFLDREAAKSDLVRLNRPHIEEATAYIAWHMQGLAEIDSASSRLPKERIVKAMVRHLAAVGGGDTEIEDVFRAVHEKIWVLTSKQSGTFEFDVQPIREYFAAWFLREYAQSDDPEFEPAVMVREMISRSYWSNTARFLAGHFSRSLLPHLADSLEEELAELTSTRQKHATTWAILADGVFRHRDIPKRRLAGLFSSDLAVRLLAEDNFALVRQSPLSADSGGLHLAAVLRDDVARAPLDPLAVTKAWLAEQLDERPTFQRWWASELARATQAESRSMWLRIGSRTQLGTGLSPSEIENLNLQSIEHAAEACEAGVTPPESSLLSELFLRSALDGHCLSSGGGTSEAADILRTAGPGLFVAMLSGSIPASNDRTKALQRMKERRPSFDKLQVAMRTGKGQGGTTSRWSNSARAISEVYGRPTWLAFEIAAIGAASDLTTGGDNDGGPISGIDLDFGAWVQEVRVHSRQPDWWIEQLSQCTDPLSQAGLVLGALAVGDATLLASIAISLDTAIRGLPGALMSPLVASSARVSRVARPVDLPALSTDLSPEAELLLAHRSRQPVDTLAKAPGRLATLGKYRSGSEVAYLAACRRAAKEPDSTHLEEMFAFDLRGVSSEASSTLRSDIAERVLREPARFPEDWIFRADEVMSKSASRLPLKTFAESRWGLV